MPQASEVFKQIAIKAETAYGTVPSATGAQLLRRVGFALNLSKDLFESNEIRPDLQRADQRHGVRRVPGTLNGELSPGSYAPYLGSVLKRDFTTTAAITGLSITIAAGSGGTWTVTRSAGSWITDGIRVGHVVRLTAGSFNVANSNKNLFVIAATPTILTVIVLNGSALVAEGPIATATLTPTGKRTFIPTSGHTDQSWTIEEWMPDVPLSEVYSGWKWNSAALQLPPTGLATVALGGNGMDLAQRATTRYFTAPTAAGTSGIVASVNGVLRIGSQTVAAVTGLTLNIAANFSGDPVLGTNRIPSQFAGRVLVSGSMTAYFDDAILRDVFVDETQTSLLLAMTTDNTATADFITFAMTRVKLNSADKSDAEGGITRTYGFDALLDSSGGANEATTISVYDSLA